MRGFAFRSWFYFRTGYGLYIALTLGLVNVLTTTYYLIPAVETFFPDFITYIIFSIVVGLPVTVGIGYLHYKKTQAYGAEMDISVESNPYYFKLAPGLWRDALGPIYLETLRLAMKTAKGEKVTEEDMKRLKEIEEKMEELNKGKRIDEI